MLNEILNELNEGRSKRYYRIAATIMEIYELEKALDEAKKQSKDLGIKEKSKISHSLLDILANRKEYFLKLRK